MQETDGEGVPDVFERLEEQAVIAPNGGGGSGGDEFSTWNPSGVKSAPSDPTEPKPLVLIWIVVFQACEKETGEEGDIIRDSSDEEEQSRGEEAGDDDDEEEEEEDGEEKEEENEE
uniref:Uncharacterized protein n=1 Tax=Chromera velia CCMP2878 TaxID=1169474 RepID=A0A0G4H7Z0_9ALVE|eukprot:Cvel_25045.t1-p1 / transcript=Cvel_25045.t1 / gene=Cvel_25045 / organism=Chromera_velia_CCMP2878 / gene_product=hypothetical protein / transcript_product=hypothetical protein / location=Cvel_scaffold2784:3030-9054(+) / protein_length=115 / sequence_SO=supercontig / SO=protein_coding / is_pseudo=false